MDTPIQAHNQKPASVWNSGGARYEEISRGIADSIEHACCASPANRVNASWTWQPAQGGPRGSLRDEALR